MFGFFNKQQSVVAPVSGNLINLSEVPDEAFAQKMVGDGVAIIPSGETFCSPIKGTISFVFETNHAFVVTSNDGIEIMVHIGIDTVKLKGQGYTRLKEVGQKVNIGDEVIKINRNIIETLGYSLITPVLILNYSTLKELKIVEANKAVNSNEVIMNYLK